MLIRTLLLLAVLMSVIAQALPCRRRLQSGGTPFTSPYLSSRLTDVEMRSGEEVMGSALYGRIDGGEIVYLGRINTHYTDDPTAVSIDEVGTAEVAQGSGVATALYDYLLKQHETYRGEPAKKLTGTSKRATNLTTVLEALVKSLATERGYKKPNPADSVSKQFWDCCAKIYEKHPKKIEEAVKESPTYKIGKKLGFEICKGTVSFSAFVGEEGPDASLNYELCRK